MSIQAIKKIDAIRFSIWSPTEIRKYSVAEITAPETYDEDGMAVQGGLMDGRLGTLEPGQKCLTCGNTAARCPGHFGHLELAEPVLHIAFIDNIYKLLQSTCRSCARLKVPQEDLDVIESEQRLDDGEQTTAFLLSQITSGNHFKTIQLSYLIAHFKGRSFGGLLLILSILALLPLVSFVAGIIILIVGVQMILGLRVPSLPQFVMHQKVGKRSFEAFVDYVVPWPV